ncbi:MAG TPA: hypothetical protein VN915_15310 [Elusimicrobiota bacterium]|nr:hypothetical protein [Elusimicrobiota bacterium]
MYRRSQLIAVILVSLASGAFAAKKGSKASSSSSEGPDLDAAARREIQCPKGFVPEKTSGPHLVVTDKAQRKAKGKKKAKFADDDAKSGGKTRTLARRCVPAESLAKPAAGDDNKDRRTAAEALRD